MKVSKFAEAVCDLESGKKEVDIAQTKEILKVANRLLGGALYKLIRNTSEV